MERISEHLTVNQIAKIAGVSGNQIRFWMRTGYVPYGTAFRVKGRTRHMYSATLNAVAEYYGLSREEVIERLKEGTDEKI